jgi:hypothetical protein
MKVLKSLVLFTVITLVFSLGLSAQEDTFRAPVEKLLLLMKQDQLVNQMFDQMKPVLAQQFQQMNLTEKQSAMVNKYYDQVFEVMKAEMSWEKIKDDFIQIYMAVFTEEEIQELIVFYQSPIGRKLVEKQPLLLQQSMALSQKYIQNILPKIQEITQEMIKEINSSTETE